MGMNINKCSLCGQKVLEEGINENWERVSYWRHEECYKWLSYIEHDHSDSSWTPSLECVLIKYGGRLCGYEL